MGLLGSRCSGGLGSVEVVERAFGDLAVEDILVCAGMFRNPSPSQRRK